MEKFSIKIEDMDLSQIAESGQVFRMREENGAYRLYTGKNTASVTENDGIFTFDCGEEEFRKIWYDYFDLDTDYSFIKSLADEKDEYLNAAIKNGWGIRILKQDLWEMIISFIISQNNNIPRIRKCIEKICDAVGGGGFPTPAELERLSVKELREFGFGYRDEYVHRMAVNTADGSFDIEALKKLDYEGARAVLMKQHGIGKKVADCICVFGLHKREAFPIDTHVRQILAEHYKDGFPFEKYQEYAAVMQQYMFYYDLGVSK